MRYLLLFLALPILLGASAGPQVLDDLGQLRFAGGPWVSSDDSNESDAWPAWDNQVRNPALVTDFSTAGWPRNYGRICVTFTAGPSGEHRAIIDGRTDGDDPRPYLAVVNDGRIRFGIQTVGSIADGEIIPFHTHTVCVDRSYGPRTSLYLDGRLIGTSTTLPAWDWHPTARLGSRYGGADPLGGEIKSIQWRGLRLSCDMRGDTCSDGRTITTTRATPVPCEVSPGVWEMVPEGTGCYSVRGLESWAANTSYLAYGAELDHPAWSRYSGISVAARDGVWEIMRNRVSLGGVYQDLDLAPVEPEAWTASCVMKAGTTSDALLVAQRSAGWTRIQLTENWNTYSVTNTVQPGQLPGLVVGPDEDQKSILVAGCWLTRASTPGRACWGGEAPVTCARDQHTISTEGWPTTSGVMRFVVTLLGDASDHRTVFDGGADATLRMAILTNGMIRISWDGSNLATEALAWEYGRPYVIELRFNGSTISMFRDGVFLRDFTYSRPVEWAATASIGANLAGGWLLNGSISSLRIRSTP